MKRLVVLLLCVLFIPVMGIAQSNPGFYTGFTPTAAQWNSYFSAKQDYLGTTGTGGIVLANNPVVASPIITGTITTPNNNNPIMFGNFVEVGVGNSLGVGGFPNYEVDIIQDLGAAGPALDVFDNSTSNLAGAGLTVNNGTHSGVLEQYGVNYNQSGLFPGDSTVLSSNATGGLWILGASGVRLGSSSGPAPVQADGFGLETGASITIGSLTHLLYGAPNSGQLGIVVSGAASTTAPGAGGAKLQVVCGTNAGTMKLIMFAGTSTTPVTIVDNVGAGGTGC